MAAAFSVRWGALHCLHPPAVPEIGPRQDRARPAKEAVSAAVACCNGGGADRLALPHGQGACATPDYTSCASRGWPINRMRDLAHCGYRHSNLTVLTPASSGSMVASRIEDPHALHITEPY